MKRLADYQVSLRYEIFLTSKLTKSIHLKFTDRAPLVLNEFDCPLKRPVSEPLIFNNVYSSYKPTCFPSSRIQSMNDDPCLYPRSPILGQVS